MRFILVIILLFIPVLLPVPTQAQTRTNPYANVLGCQKLNHCNGHGTCNHSRGECICDTGWGSPTEISILGFQPSSDCTQRTCPFGKAWASVPISTEDAHPLAECSNMGLCDRSYNDYNSNNTTNTTQEEDRSTGGTCSCFDGFRGLACEYKTCPGTNMTSNNTVISCSGHGSCVSMKHLASKSNALPLSSSSDLKYSGNPTTTTWDQYRMVACLCDSSWSVGLGSGETQEPEWFGADCSLRRCPSDDNPDTPENEIDCSGKLALGGRGTGEPGNKCHYDCSGRGTCDYSTGTCHCFESFYGSACELRQSRRNS